MNITLNVRGDEYFFILSGLYSYRRELEQLDLSEEVKQEQLEYLDALLIKVTELIHEKTPRITLVS